MNIDKTNVKALQVAAPSATGEKKESSLKLKRETLLTVRSGIRAGLVDITSTPK